MKQRRCSRVAGSAVTGAVVASLALASGCGERPEPEPMPVEDTVFAEQVETIDRAQERAREMEGRMQDLNEQLDSAEGARAREDDAEPDSRN